MLVTIRGSLPSLNIWFLACVYRDRPVLIVHGDKREAKARLVQQAQPFPHIRFCQVHVHHHPNTLSLKCSWLILETLICGVGQ